VRPYRLHPPPNNDPLTINEWELAFKTMLRSIDVWLVFLPRNFSITTMMRMKVCPYTPSPSDYFSARRDVAKRWHRVRDWHKVAFGMITRRLSADKERPSAVPSRDKQLFEVLAEPCEVW
jgi:hypothetical protein